MKKTIPTLVLLGVAALTAFCGNSASASILYGITGAGGSASSLYMIDPTTGSATLVGATGFSHVASLDFDPTTGILYGIANDTDELIMIDTTTGVGTTVATVTATGGWDNAPDIAFDALGTLYTWSEATPDRLNTIDLVTGVATEIGPNSLAGGTFQLGLDIDSSGTIYIKNGDGEIYTVDSGTGAVTFVDDIDPDFIYDNVLAFDASDTLFTLDRTGGDSDLFTIDLGAGTTTFIGSTGLGSLSALAFAPAAAVPEPATLAIWSVLGAAGLAVRIRRKRK